MFLFLFPVRIPPPYFLPLQLRQQGINDQLRQQGINATLQSLRTDVAAFLNDKEYAWSQFHQDDAPNWAAFVLQVGYTSPGGFFVNHTVIEQLHACKSDLTIIQCMPDKTYAFELLSGKSLAMNLTDRHHDETVQRRKANVQGVVQPLFLAQRGMEHIMGTELFSSSLSTHASCLQIDPTVGLGQGAATAERPRLPSSSTAGAPSAGPQHHKPAKVSSPA